MECENPNDRIYKFEGVFQAMSGHNYSLSADNMLLRGSSLKNTDYVYGLVVYTGHDTKIMLNSTSARNKFSRNEKMTNIQVLLIFIVQITICAFYYGTLWERSNRIGTYSYLNIDLLYEDNEARSWVE